MSPNEMRDILRRQPFEPFRIVMTDGVTYDIRHPDLMMIGFRTAYVGLVGPGRGFVQGQAHVDLIHIIRTEPLEPVPRAAGGNGAPGAETE